MTFIPTVPYVPPAPPSGRAYELSTRVKASIEEFLRENPETSGLEIRQAVDLAARSFRKGTAQKELLIVLLALLILGVGLGAFFARRFGLATPTLIFSILIGVGILAVGGALLLKRG